jgi:hypothetical protein
MFRENSRASHREIESTAVYALGGEHRRPQRWPLRLYADAVDPNDVREDASPQWALSTRARENRVRRGDAEAGEHLVAVADRHRHAFEHGAAQMTERVRGRETGERPTEVVPPMRYTFSLEVWEEQKTVAACGDRRSKGVEPRRAPIRTLLHLASTGTNRMPSPRCTSRPRCTNSRDRREDTEGSAARPGARSDADGPAGTRNLDKTTAGISSLQRDQLRRGVGSANNDRCARMQPEAPRPTRGQPAADGRRAGQGWQAAGGEPRHVA